MPFKSQAQRRLFWAKARKGEMSPGMVREWEDATPKGKKLPEHVKKAGALQDFLTEGHHYVPVKRALFHSMVTPVRTGVGVGAPAGAVIGAGVGAARAKKGERKRGALEGAAKGLAAGTAAGLGWGAGVRGMRALRAKKGRMLHDEAATLAAKLRAEGKASPNDWKRAVLGDKSAPPSEAAKAWDKHTAYVEKSLRDTLLSGAGAAAAAGTGTGIALRKRKKPMDDKVKHAFVMYESALREIARIGESGI